MEMLNNSEKIFQFLNDFFGRLRKIVMKNELRL